MDEMHVFNLVFEAASSVAQGRVPADVQGPLMSARLTALPKDDGGVDATFRRLVARSGEAIRGRFRERVCPISVRAVHASRDRLRGTCCGRQPTTMTGPPF